MNNNALAKIAKGTKRKKRELNLLEISNSMKSFYQKHKSLDKVAKIVGISPEMVREFLKINELAEEVRELIRLRKIDSVEIGYRISKLEKDDQITLARKVLNQNLSSGDVRAIVKFKIDNPEMPIENVVNRVIRSKDKKIFVVYLGIEKNTFKKISEKKAKVKIVKSIFNKVISPKFVVSFELNGRVVIIKVEKEGLQQMKSKAKELKVPLATLADALVKEYLKGN